MAMRWGSALTPLLAQVQARRLFPARVTQAAPVAAQNGLVNPPPGRHPDPKMPQ
ncbi:MAG: hypothetical protein ACREBY_09630 [Polaromonas sp.]